jgi:putative alpha-1,2-mannosidase
MIPLVFQMSWFAVAAVAGYAGQITAAAIYFAISQAWAIAAYLKERR